MSARDWGAVRTRSWPLNWNDGVNALCSPSRCGSKSRGTDALAPVCGNERPYHWARTFIERRTNKLSPWRSAVYMVRFASAMTVLHIVEILVWACFYRWKCFSAWGASFYFSAASYSTVGYGDVLLPQIWRALGPVESLTGMLMCGMSVSGLFAILTRILAAEDKSSAGATT